MRNEKKTHKTTEIMGMKFKIMTLRKPKIVSKCKRCMDIIKGSIVEDMQNVLSMLVCT